MGFYIVTIPDSSPALHNLTTTSDYGKDSSPTKGIVVLVVLAEEQGLEPRFCGPKPHVLPLDDSPLKFYLYLQYYHM